MGLDDGRIGLLDNMDAFFFFSPYNNQKSQLEVRNGLTFKTIPDSFLNPFRGDYDFWSSWALGAQTADFMQPWFSEEKHGWAPKKTQHNTKL